jgi:hypothetical protein
LGKPSPPKDIIRNELKENLVNAFIVIKYISIDGTENQIVQPILSIAARSSLGFDNSSFFIGKIDAPEKRAV